MRSATVTATSPRLVGGLPNWAGKPEMSTVRIFPSLRTTADPLSVWNAPWPRLAMLAVLPSHVADGREGGLGLAPTRQLLHREHKLAVRVSVEARVDVVDPRRRGDRRPDPERLVDLRAVPSVGTPSSRSPKAPARRGVAAGTSPTSWPDWPGLRSSRQAGPVRRGAARSAQQTASRVTTGGGGETPPPGQAGGRGRLCRRARRWSRMYDPVDRRNVAAAQPGRGAAPSGLLRRPKGATSPASTSCTRTQNLCGHVAPSVAIGTWS